MQRLALLALAVIAAVSLVLLLTTNPRSSADGGDPGSTDGHNGIEADDDSRTGLVTPAALEARTAAERLPSEWESSDGVAAGVAIQGRVVAADGGPLDEVVRVVASWKSVESSGRERRDEFAPVDAGGSFVLRLPGTASRVRLDIDAEYLALAEPLPLELDALPEEVVLSAVRGGRLRVVFTGSAADAQDARPGADFSLIAKGVANGQSFDRAARTGVDGVVRIGGLPGDSAWRVHLVATEFVDRIVPARLVRPGETADVEVPLDRGVSVRGTVIDDAGSPVEGASVLARSWKQFDARILTGRSVNGVSDADGRFEVAGLLAGDVSAQASAAGLRRATEDLGRRENGEIVEGVVIRLDAGARLTGAVVWPDGSPATGASVRVVGQGRTWGGAATVTTDDAGRFALEGVAQGPWRVGAWSHHPTDGALWRVVVEPVAAREVTLTLEEGARVSGNVVDDVGAPIETGRVTATPVGQDSGSGQVTARFKKSGGAFVLDGVGAGRWDLSAEAAAHGEGSPVRVDVPLDADGVRIVLPRLASLAGKVTNELGAPISEARIRAGGRSDVTAEDGSFALTKLQPGEQVVQVSDAGECGPPIGEPIVLVPGEERVDASIVLMAGARILGEIHANARTGTELNVSVRPHDSYAMQKALVDSEGKFTFVGLAPGTYRVAFDWTGVNDWVSGYQMRREVMVELEPGETEHVVLGDPGDYPITVSGELRENGEPIEGLLMYVFDVDAPENQPLMVARSNEQGRYEVDLPRSGPTMFTVGYGQQRQARFVRELTDEPQQTIDFDLPFRTLSGRLVRDDGKPVTARLVLLTHADAPAGTAQLGQVQFAMSDSEGRFEFEGLHPGEYRLRSGNYVKAHATDGLVVREGVVIPEEGAAPEVELVIGDGAVLEVTATDGSGQPLSEHRVDVLDAAGWPAVVYDQRRTDYAGTLRFTGLGTGPATAVVLGDGGVELGRAEVQLEAGRQQVVTVVCDRGETAPRSVSGSR